MECTEVRVDTRIKTPEETEIGKRNAELAFELNHTMPMTERYMEILHELFGDKLGEGSFVMAPIKGVCFDRVKIGKGVYINADCLMMARGETDPDLQRSVGRRRSNHPPGNPHRETRGGRSCVCRNQRCTGLCCRGRKPRQSHQDAGCGQVRGSGVKCRGQPGVFMLIRRPSFRDGEEKAHRLHHLGDAACAFLQYTSRVSPLLSTQPRNPFPFPESAHRNSHYLVAFWL